MKQRDFEQPCSKYVYWVNCLGSCRSLALSIGKKLLSPHPFCRVLYDSIKNNKIDKNLLLDAELVDIWIREIENPNYVAMGITYGDLVKKQHLEENN